MYGPNQRYPSCAGNNARGRSRTINCNDCGLLTHTGIDCMEALRKKIAAEKRSAASSSSSSSKSAAIQEVPIGPTNDDEDDTDDSDNEGEVDPMLEEQEEQKEEPVAVEPVAKKARKKDLEQEKKKEDQARWLPYQPLVVHKKRAVDSQVKVDPIPTSKVNPKASARNIPAGTTTPIAYFQLYFTAALMAIIVSSTNLYGVWKFANGWKVVTTTEMYHFIAVLI